MNKYEAVKAYMRSNGDDFESVLWDMDEMFVFWREHDGFPIYLTKGRVKKVDSVFLKTIKDGVEVNEIKDLIGLRLICLFEKDIYKVNRFFWQKVRAVQDGYEYDANDFSQKRKDAEKICNDISLHGCKAFNWGESSEEYKELKDGLRETHPGLVIVHKKKKTGYKSVHYTIKVTKGNVRCFLEVQLRTHVQDVWGELEHALAYKQGAVHPFIKKSVYLLSKELQNIESLFSHLRTISDQENCGKRHLNYNVRPRYVFFYEDAIIKKCFSDNEKMLFKEYSDHLKGYESEDMRSGWLEKLKDLLGRIKSELVNKKDNEWVRYWLNMEDAFCLFCESKYSQAISKYEALMDSYSKRYCIYFRLGELYSIVGKDIEALNCFYEASSLINAEAQTDYLNQFRIKTRLALMYWMMGGDFILNAKKEIDFAERLYEKIRDDDKSGIQYATLCNNLCWYYLERYILAKEKFLIEGKGDENLGEYFAEAEEKYHKLEPLLNDVVLTRNVIDTAAWYNYQMYKATRYEAKKNNELLRKARALCLRMREYKNASLYSFKSRDIQAEHFQEIMSVSEEELRVSEEELRG